VNVGKHLAVALLTGRGFATSDRLDIDPMRLGSGFLVLALVI